MKSEKNTASLEGGKRMGGGGRPHKFEGTNPLNDVGEPGKIASGSNEDLKQVLPELPKIRGDEWSEASG